MVKTERIDKILVAAMKQSHKAFKPRLNGMEDFKKFVSRPFSGQKFIAHCYDEADVRGEDKAETDKTMDGESLSCWTYWKPTERRWSLWDRKETSAWTRCAWRWPTDSVP